jgi:hypothetical protein
VLLLLQQVVGCALGQQLENDGDQPLEQPITTHQTKPNPTYTPTTATPS